MNTSRFQSVSLPLACTDRLSTFQRNGRSYICGSTGRQDLQLKCHHPSSIWAMAEAQIHSQRSRQQPNNHLERSRSIRRFHRVPAVRLAIPVANRQRGRGRQDSCDTVLDQINRRAWTHTSAASERSESEIRQGPGRIVGRDAPTAHGCAMGVGQQPTSPG